MIFTQEQINEIRRRLAEGGMKDSDLPSADKIEGDELCAIVQEGVNKKIPLWKLFNSPAFETYYQLLQDTITDRMNQLERLIEQVKRENLSVSDEFGDSDTVTISQKTLTNAFNQIWSKLSDMTGELTQGIRMTVSPDYFISEDGCEVHITASTTDANGKFEKIQFFINGILVAEGEDTEYFEKDIHIDETAVIMCKAKIMGIEYTEQKTIIHYNSFWLGAGSDYTEVMIQSNLIPVEYGMRGAYNVVVNNDYDHIIVIVGSGLTRYLRIDMNGFEIPTTMEEVTIGGDTFKVFTSINGFKAGTYNIDVNG